MLPQDQTKGKDSSLDYRKARSLEPFYNGVRIRKQGLSHMTGAGLLAYYLTSFRVHQACNRAGYTCYEMGRRALAAY